MPLYEYQCKMCGSNFEQIVRFSEADMTPSCPSCGHADTQKKISAAASFGTSSPDHVTASANACSPHGRFT